MTLMDVLRERFGEWGPAAWLAGWGILCLVGWLLIEIDYDRKRRGRD